MSQQAASGPDRMHWLDGVRGAAALFVVLHHMWLSTWPNFPNNDGPWFVGPLLYGHLAVAVFIVVSGFSLALSPLRHDGELGGTKRFIQRRAWRILPPYWVALAFSMILFVLVLRPDLGTETVGKSFLIHATLVQDVFENVPPPGAFWSIAVEWQIYFVFPLILLVVRQRGIVLAVALTTLVVIVGHFLAGSYSLFEKINYVSPQFLALFAFGVLAAWIAHGRGPAIPRAGLIAVAAGGVIGTVVLHLVKGSPWMASHWFWVDLLFGTAVAAALLLTAQSRRPWRMRTLGSRPAVFLGAFSYSLYLMHAQLLELIHKYVMEPLDLPPLVGFAVLVAFGLPLILLLSYGFFCLFERPFLHRRDLASLRTLPVVRVVSGVLRRKRSVPAPVG